MRPAGPVRMIFSSLQQFRSPAACASDASASSHRPSRRYARALRAFCEPMARMASVPIPNPQSLADCSSPSSTRGDRSTDLLSSCLTTRVPIRFRSCSAAASSPRLSRDVATFPTDRHSVHHIRREADHRDQPVELSRSTRVPRRPLARYASCDAHQAIGVVIGAIGVRTPTARASLLHSDTPPRWRRLSPLPPTLQEWAARPPTRCVGARFWIDRPPPLEIRLAESADLHDSRRTARPPLYLVRLPPRSNRHRRLHAALDLGSDYVLVDRQCAPAPTVGWAELVAPSVRSFGLLPLR